MLHFIWVKVWGMCQLSPWKIGKKSRVVSSASKLHYPRRLLESSWMIFSLFCSTSIHMYVSLCQKKHVLTKTMAFSKTKNVFQNSWSSTLLWPVLPQEAAMHKSNSWCCSLFPKAPGPSITNMIFPSGKKPESTHIQTPQRVCVAEFSTSSPSSLTKYFGIVAFMWCHWALTPWFHVAVNQRVVPPQAPNRFLRFIPTKQVEQAATVHNPRSCLGVQGVFFLPSWVTNTWWCSFLFQWWDILVPWRVFMTPDCCLHVDYPHLLSVKGECKSHGLCWRCWDKCWGSINIKELSSGIRHVWGIHMKYHLEQPLAVHPSAMFNNPLLNVAKSTANQFEAHVCEDGFAVANRKTEIQKYWTNVLISLTV